MATEKRYLSGIDKWIDVPEPELVSLCVFVVDIPSRTICGHLEGDHDEFDGCQGGDPCTCPEWTPVLEQPEQQSDIDAVAWLYDYGMDVADREGMITSAHEVIRAQQATIAERDKTIDAQANLLIKRKTYIVTLEAQRKELKATIAERATDAMNGFAVLAELIADEREQLRQQQATIERQKDWLFDVQWADLGHGVERGCIRCQRYESQGHDADCVWTEILAAQ